MGRYFFGLNLPNHTKQQIAHWRDEYLPHDNKSVILENFHITLVFLGVVETSVIKQCIVDTGSIRASKFSITLCNLGFWKKPKVLFLGSNIVAEALQTLVHDLSQMALINGIKLVERPYIPHLTLCRKATTLPNIMTQPKFDINAVEFCLYESTSTVYGVKYEVVHRWPLS